VDDLADACIFLLEKLNAENLYLKMKISHLNIGYGSDIAISELAELIAKIVGYKGSIEFDHSKPDGTPRKLLDVTRIKNLGWEPKIKLKDGIKLSYNWFIKNYKN
jgi:GDP-L-fucose synthase